MLPPGSTGIALVDICLEGFVNGPISRKENVHNFSFADAPRDTHARGVR